MHIVNAYYEVNYQEEERKKNMQINFEYLQMHL